MHLVCVFVVVFEGLARVVLAVALTVAAVWACFINRIRALTRWSKVVAAVCGGRTVVVPSSR